MSTPEPSYPFDVVDSVTRGGTTFEVLEWRRLAGTEPIAIARQLFELNRAEVRLRQLRIRLNEDAVRTEPGALVPVLEGQQRSAEDAATKVDAVFARWNQTTPGCAVGVSVRGV